MRNGVPLVSIGMPVRNCQGTLDAAVRSIVQQTFTDWELLLIDDGSTDDTLAIARRYRDPRIRLTSESNSLGLAVRLNEAIAASRGGLFARMDGDDIAYPWRFERQVECLERNPDVVLTGAAVVVFGRAGVALGKRTAEGAHEAICATPRAGFGIVHPTFVGRLGWFRRWQFEPGAGPCCDQDLLLRAYTESRFTNVPAILLGYREESIRLRRLLAYRLRFSRSLLRRYGKSNRLLALRSAAAQAAKGLVDCIAVCSGLKYRLLQHRAQPLTPEEREEWDCVWNSVHSAEGLAGRIRE
ncbi:MAG: glycosyltransferase family A protein [Acidobacteriota bacterium]